MDIHLASASEDDPVLVDQIDLPRRFDLPHDLGGRPAGVFDRVEGDPLPDAFAAETLIKDDAGIAPHVKCLPVQECLLDALFDGYTDATICIGLDRGICSDGRSDDLKATGP